MPTRASKLDAQITIIWLGISDFVQQMFKSNFDSVALTGIGLFARDSSPEEALRMMPAPPTNKTANIIA